MAYKTRMAAALSGASIRQLAYWRRPAGPILVPEVSARPVRYSFRDVVALRTTVYLRQEQISLQRIRRALETLAELGEFGHLSQYRLVAQGNSVVLVDAEETVDLVGRPGQRVTTVLMAAVLRSFPTDATVVPDLLRPRQNLLIDPEIRGGHPVVSGTRVPFDLIAGLVRSGVPAAEIADYYPAVNAPAAHDAADFAGYLDRFNRRRPA
ncbi:DUF433 domain-containing protein [Kribbella qitaiheensis]|uniref:DUF433 domain-containing protein n=1 Tax=Kribbella qitaiheensis TaxID=1544730 RepID=A0A7G6X089_9ACTN|nr:DUF433 domain-containing protein [Kribbella qitaiheensis]QNE19654.1 DUF433 domain-containing protein [Kribbella qitaiheensis]